LDCHIKNGGEPNVTEPPQRQAAGCAAWAATLAAMRRPGAAIPPPWDGIFAPLAAAADDGLMVVAQIGQSLDGRIATPSGDSYYINGEDGLDHLHRLRAIADAVVVGVGTVCTDNPQLTVRRVAGPHPARVVIDPNGRLPQTARLLAPDGVRCIVIRHAGVQAALPGHVEVIACEPEGPTIAPPTILARLAASGLRRILIEGGARTLSCFLEARCLDHIHIVVAPVILGAGAHGIALPAVERVKHALRPRTRVHMLGKEVLFDCDLSDQRVAIGRAKKSM
jgi:riboflavin-specific deaminase-like protein